MEAAGKLLVTNKETMQVLCKPSIYRICYMGPGIFA